MAINTDRYTQSPFIKGDELEEGERMILTIKAAYETTFPSGDTVPVLEFLETDQKLTLNKTRVRKAVELFGPDSDAWINRQVALYAVPVQFNGKSQMGIAIAGVKQAKTTPAVTFDEVEETPF